MNLALDRPAWLRLANEVKDLEVREDCIEAVSLDIQKKNAPNTLRRESCLFHELSWRIEKKTHL